MTATDSPMVTAMTIRRRYERPSLVLSAGPTGSREATDDDPPYEPPKIGLGFAPPPREVEPLTWDGDQA